MSGNHGFSGLALLGGSFNPPHIGHFRLALEAYEAMRPQHLLFIPSATPPHKPVDTLLSFPLRERMLRAGLAEITASYPFDVSDVETRREGRSYTIDTLRELRRQFPGYRPQFILGSEDYQHLSSWREWRHIPQLADLVVFARMPRSPDFFHNVTRAMWPDAQAAPGRAGGQIYLLVGGGSVYYFSRPILEVSSSLIRDRFLSGLSLDFLMPQGTLKLLAEHASEVRRLWRGEAV